VRLQTLRDTRANYSQWVASRVRAIEIIQIKTVSQRIVARA